MQTVTGSETAIWSRVIEPERTMLSAEAARALLALGSSAWDKARMNELAAKHRQGLLNDDEREELDGYVTVGDVLSLLHLKARKSLAS